MQKYSGSQKLSQIGKSRLFSYIFQHSNFRNKFIIVFYSYIRVVRKNFRMYCFFLLENIYKGIFELKN
ncbi:hypothetical protein LEP1GSC188_1549 [Leptospira weilii serovar Topaz str. LT2116]|uniref:Uncharacterized protein n=1 Tax=Leptospira weilii serovar Topaz str. LT2116 TaxID=1088540 RepID=M3G158_9LEPT|nr:hypothetical protein LEP1GSC188_1549 [Leptospira weilii serovar Topaz str. LT2116]